MASSVQDSEHSKFYAGLYLRTHKLTRFWGWGKAAFEQAWQGDLHNEDQSRVEIQPNERGTDSKANTQTQTRTAAQWSSLAEWLRMAHSSELFKDDGDSRSENRTGLTDSQQPSRTTVESSESKQTRKRRLRFVCDRKFIGLAIQ